MIVNGSPDEIPCRYMWSLKLTGVKHLPALVPVQNYYSQNFSDNALCSNSSCIEFVKSRPEGYYSVVSVYKSLVDLLF